MLRRLLKFLLRILLQLETKKGQEKPPDGIIDATRCVTAIGPPIHAWNQKHVDQPTNKKEAASAEPQGSRQRFPKIKAMGSGKAHDPQKIPNEFAVRVHACRQSLRVQE